MSIGALYCLGIVLSAVFLTGVAPVSAAAEWNFARPRVAPEPVSLEYQSNVCCRLDGKALVRVTCNDAQAAQWIGKRIRLHPQSNR